MIWFPNCQVRETEEEKKSEEKDKALIPKTEDVKLEAKLEEEETEEESKEKAKRQKKRQLAKKS